MASKVTKNLDIESKVIKCKNCRQDILKDKMFLHEGFCIRNNVFCEHCEKVFLKKDYAEHVKLATKFFSKNKNSSSPISQQSKETQSETFKAGSLSEENENNNNTMPLIPKPSLEIVQMPITELYKINEPIFVNESGQILSNNKNNKNNYLLPFLGINFRSSKINEKILDDIIDQGDIFIENNTISQNCYDIEGLNNLLNRNNYNNNNYLTINPSQNPKEKEYSLGFSNLRENNSITSFNRDRMMNGQISPLSKTIEINNFNSYKVLNEENKTLKRKPYPTNFNSIYIDKSIANNSQKILQRKYNFFTFQNTPQKVPENRKSIHHTLTKNNNEIIPLDKVKNTPKTKGQVLDSMECDYYKSYNKEPKDSNSKRNNLKKSMVFSRFSGAKNKEQVYNSERRKITNKKDSNICQHCHNTLGKNKYENHIQNCKEKKKRMSILEIPKPRKKKNVKNIDTYFLDQDEEIGIDEKKRETLTRQFNPTTLNVIELHCDKNNQTLISNPEKNEYNSKFMNYDKKISLKKNLFHIIKEEKSDKKIFPEDSNREELNKIKKSKLRKRLYNLSIDFKSYDDINEKIKSNKSMVPIIKNKNLKSGVIDPSLCFNNNKVIFRYPKDKMEHK